MENYTPKFKINDKVYFEDKEYFVRGMMAKECSHPNPEIEYCLSELENRPCTSNISNKTAVNENKILSLKDYKSKKIKEAKDFLISEGVIPQE
jgi:hypothetical protein